MYPQHGSIVYMKKPKDKPIKSKHSEDLHIRLMSGQKDKYQKAADKAEMPLSVWIRTRLSMAADKELK